MADSRTPDTRTRLLEAAAGLLAARPGEVLSMRAVCEAAGVKMPTLHHFFGTKDGLLEALAALGVDRLMASVPPHADQDPLQGIRELWDAHVAFGVANPGFYALMYGQPVPGSLDPAEDRPARALTELAHQADRQGRLVVGVEQAVAQVMAASIGVTLRQIVLDAPDPELSASAREATIAAVAGDAAEVVHDGTASEASRLLAALPEVPEGFTPAEAALLRQWLKAL